MTKKKHLIIGGVIAAVVIILGVTCFVKLLHMYRNTHQKLDQILADSSPDTANGSTDSSIQGTLTLNVNKIPVSIDLGKPESTYDCPTLNTEFDTIFELDPETDYKVTVDGQSLGKGGASLKLDSLSKNNLISVSVESQTYYLRTLPEKFPNLVAQGESCRDGYFYTTFADYAVKFDKKGQVVFYRSAKASNAGPFRRNDIDGEVFYSYLESSPSSTHVFLTGIGYGQTSLKVLDEQYNLIDEVPYMVQTDKIPADYPLENHDYLILGKGHYLLSTYLGKRVTNIPADVEGHEYGANVVAEIIQEVKDGECIFEWDSTDHPELYAASAEAGDYTNTSRIWSDYVHFNGIAIDPKDNNLLCSFRNLDSILKINRTTGEIMWYLGGKNDQFGLTEDQKFYRQHNISVADDGSLLLFDNHCLLNILGYPEQTEEEQAAYAPQQVSRGLKITIDEENFQVTGFKEYRQEQFFSATMGSMQILEDSTDTALLGWGGKSLDGMPLFSEVNCQDKTVNFEMLCYDENINCYRTNFYEK